MTEPPRRLTRTVEADRDRTVGSTHTAQSGQGQTKAARPVTGNARQAQIYHPPAPVLGRLSVLYRTFSPAGFASNDKIYVPSWTSTEEDESQGQIVAASGAIGIFAAGVYSVHLFVHAEGMQSAAASCSIIGFCDYFHPFSESFGAVTRGGDPSSGLLFPSTSRTYYHPASGAFAFQPGLAWANLDTVNVTDILLEVQVQRIA